MRIEIAEDIDWIKNKLKIKKETNWLFFDERINGEIHYSAAYNKKTLTLYMLYGCTCCNYWIRSKYNTGLFYDPVITPKLLTVGRVKEIIGSFEKFCNHIKELYLKGIINV
jgi:hypothetical protein